MVGVAGSSNFPIVYNSTSASLIDSTFNGGQDGFISRFDLEKYQVTSIKQVDFDQSMLFLYPNPTNTQFNLEIEGILSSKANVKVYNLIGQIILEKQIEGFNTAINCESWPNGVYLVSVSNKESQTTLKLIKQ